MELPYGTLEMNDPTSSDEPRCKFVRHLMIEGPFRDHSQTKGSRTRLPQFKFFAKFLIDLRVILELQIKKNMLSFSLYSSLFIANKYFIDGQSMTISLKQVR